MKICVIQGAFFPVPTLLGGAVEKMWYRLGQEFSSLGHEVIHISRSYEGLLAQETYKGVKYLRVPGYAQPRNIFILKFYDLLYSRRACRVVPSDVDVIITNTFWAPVLLCGKLKSRIYVDIQRMPKGQSKLYPRAARLRANSTPVADAIRAELPVETHSRVTLVPNPLPFDRVGSVEASQKKQRILYCGRIHPEKGLDTLLKIAQKLPQDWSVEIVGPWEISQGGGGNAYLDHLKELARNANVTFHGPIFDTEKLANHYREAAVFVYPSIAEKGETFGLAPLEAMAWQCVPVVSNLDCFKDFIKNGHNGLIYDHRAADASDQLLGQILSLVSNTEYRSNLMIEAAKVNQTHSPNRIANLFLSDFEKIIRENDCVV